MRPDAEEHARRALKALESAASRADPAVREAITVLRVALGSPVGQDLANQGERRRILVADDDDLILRAMTRALSRSFEVCAVSDGDAAWQAILEERPDGVILDVSMPGLTGTELTERIRANPDTADLPVLMVTARTSERNVAKGFSAGADEYLSKPFRPRELRCRLNRLLDKQRAASIIAREHDVLRVQADLATEILHDMGNVLNSVGVSAAALRDSNAPSHARGVERAGDLLNTVLSDEAPDNDKASRLPLYLSKIAAAMDQEHERQVAAASALTHRVDALQRLLLRAREGNVARVQRLSIRDAIHEALVVCDGTLSAAAVRCDVLCDDDAAVRADPDRLQQVFVNLLKNASEAMAQCEVRRLTVAVDIAGGQVCIRVTDTGRGIRADDVGHVFDRGFSTKSSSRGIGLPSVSRILAEMDGAISVHSAGLGRGACFEIRLPVCEAAAAG